MLILAWRSENEIQFIHRIYIFFYILLILLSYLENLEPIETGDCFVAAGALRFHVPALSSDANGDDFFDGVAEEVVKGAGFGVGMHLNDAKNAFYAER